jgi:hypothetical protein
MKIMTVSSITITVGTAMMIAVPVFLSFPVKIKSRSFKACQLLNICLSPIKKISNIHGNWSI